VLAIIVPIPARLDELAGRDYGGVADNGDQIPLAARLHTQHGKAVSSLWNVTCSTSPVRISASLSVGCDFIANAFDRRSNTIRWYSALHPVSSDHAGNRSRAIMCGAPRSMVRRH
jgi:hypothetical protein